MTYNYPTPAILVGVPTGTLQAWLADAQLKYSQLLTGGKPVSVSYDGKSVTYNTADASQLQSWIYMLQQALGNGRGRRALRLKF